MPDQDDHDEIEDGQDDQPERMSVAVAIELVGNERAKGHQRKRISDELFPKKADHEDDFDQAVACKVKRIEGLRRSGQMLCGIKQMRCDEVPGVFGQFILCQAVDHVQHGLGADQVEHKSGTDFCERVQSFEDNANPEYLMDTVLADVHGGENPKRKKAGNGR